MFATLSRPKDFDQLVRRFSGPTRIGEAPARPRQRNLRSNAVRNQHRPPAAVPQRHVERMTTDVPVAGKAKEAMRFPATGIYAAHPMLRRIANLEARLTQAAWAEAEHADAAISVASGFRYRPGIPAAAEPPAPPRAPTRLDDESERAMEIAVRIHEERIARGQPVYPDRTWYREGLVRRALQQL